MMDRPQRLHAAAYALCYTAAFPRLQAIAREHGYALAVHGSMATDLDLVAVPWIPDAADAATLVDAIRESIGGALMPWDDNPAKRPHGRLAWSLCLPDPRCAESFWPYIDLSVMPRHP